MKRAALYLVLMVFMLTLSSQALALEVNRKVTPEGLTVLHVERTHLPMVVFVLLVNAGAVDEPAERAGLASLTAGLLEEGTERRTSSEISEELEFIGARYSSSAGMDYTTLSFTVLKKDLKKGFDVFADVLLNPVFPEDEVVRVKELVKGSLKQREEDPSFVARKAFLKEVYGDHPYGRIVAGTPETVEAVRRDDIVAFHSTYFVPNNSILAVVGDINGVELDGLIGKFLGNWKAGLLRERDISQPKKPSRKVVKIDRDLTQANIVLGHLGVRRENPDYYALMVMNYILGGGGFSSRLMTSVRDEMGLAYDVHSYFSPGKLSGSFESGVQTKNVSANKVIEEILRQIRLIREQTVSSRELEDAKSFLVGSYPRKFDTMGKVAGFLVQVEYFDLGLDYIEQYPGLVSSVTELDVLRVAKKYLDPDNLVLVVVADQEKANIVEPSRSGEKPPK